jgi:hypothetical protein
MQYEYVHLSRDGGRRVFMNNPGSGGSGGTAYDRLCEIFRLMVRAAHLDLRYRMAEQISGFEVLVADDRFFAMSPWKHGTELCIAVYPNARSRGEVFSDSGAWRIDANSAVPNGLNWVHLQDGHLKIAAKPSVFPPDDPERIVPEKIENERREKGDGTPVWPLTVNNKTYRIAHWNGKAGLWQFARGHTPKLVIEGDFLWPVISPDGKWAVLAQSKESWAAPNFTIRVDLTTGKSSRLDIPDADRIKPLAFVAARGAVLVESYRENQRGNDRAPVGPETHEFRLVDPSSGRVRIVQGEFSPLEDLGARHLQRVSIAGRTWGAIYRETAGATEIGIYDPSDFVFTPVLSVPGLKFGSQQLWVDEPEHRAYISYGGQLLRISVPELRH